MVLKKKSLSRDFYYGEIMKLKNVIACLAVLAFVSGSTCAMAKNVDNQQKVEKQEKVEKKTEVTQKSKKKKQSISTWYLDAE